MSNRRIGRAALLAALIGITIAPAAGADALRPDQAAFRDLYKELVETNTTLSAGDCTLAAQRMAARLRAAGYPDADLHLFTAPDHPKEGGLVAVLPGTNRALPALLLLAHIDVVEAKREDWTRDPFTLIEEGDYFYARGSFDDKAEASIWTDTLIRLRAERVKPVRTVKMALTCGEETAGAFNGAQYLASHERELIDAGFALNEGAWGVLDAHGKRVIMTVQAGEKTSQNYQLEVTNPGGHSSRPVKDNAIYHLAAGLTRISGYEFPIQLNDTTRTYFTRMSGVVGGDMGAAMLALVKDPTDARAIATVTQDSGYNAILHTTCVATMLDAGHATNALPQRARANINCRVYPGVSLESVRQTLADVVADKAINVTMLVKRNEPVPPPPLTREIMQPFEQLSAKYFPGVPVIPILQAGGTDGVFLGAVGIPTYGVGPFFTDPDLGNVHGLNERIRIKSLFDGRDFLYELVKIYAGRAK